MNYHEAIDYIHSLGHFGSKPGLKRIKALTARLGNPHRRLQFIHIAGTNGKGSTAAFLSSILSCSGRTTGLYTSPYLVRFNERIRLNGREIADEDLAYYTASVKKVVTDMVKEGHEHPTEFEVITALAFLYFLEKKCDVVVLETGMGGRFDATNIIERSMISVVTKIAMDHMGILGDTLQMIAYEKAGIIKPCGKVVSYLQEDPAGEVIASVCREKKALLYTADVNEITGVNLNKKGLTFTHSIYGELRTSVMGAYQVHNAAVTLKTVEILGKMGYSIGKEAIAEGFARAEWPGRFELLRENPDFYIDAAHNPDGIRSFVQSFQQIYPGKKAIVIFGVMKDKEYETMIRDLSVVTKRFIAVTPDTPRALPGNTLAAVMRKYCENVAYRDTIKEAVENTITEAEEDDVIAALGSLYYIGNVRSILREQVEIRG